MAFLINDLQAGGAERLVKDLAIEMRGYEDVATMVIVANPIEELISDLKDSGVTIVSCGTSISTLSILHATWRLCQVLQDQEIDVVYSYLFFSHVVGYLVHDRRRNPYVSTYYNILRHVIEGIGKSSLNSKRMEVIHEMIGAEKLCVRSSGHHYTETESSECMS